MEVPIWSILVIAGLMGTLTSIIWALVMERLKRLETWRESVDASVAGRVAKLEVWREGLDMSVAGRTQALETWRDEIDREFWPIKFQIEAMAKREAERR